MISRMILAALVAGSLSAVVVAQGYGPGGCGGANADTGCAAGGGHGGMHGHAMGGGGSLMTPEEMQAHRDAMHSLKSVDECRAYVGQHRAAMQARAQQQGITPGPGPRADMCERMAARGFFQ
jgi:hypothetical protein